MKGHVILTPLKYNTHNKPLLEIYMFCMNHIFIQYTVTQHHHPLLTVVSYYFVPLFRPTSDHALIRLKES